MFDAVLAQIPLFSNLPDDGLSHLASMLFRRRFERDQIIFHKNDPGSTLYIIISGKVKILLPSAEEDNVLVALLSTGDFFGELSLFDGEPRSATAMAAESTEILTLDQKDLFDFLTEQPQIALKILGELSLRLRRTDEFLTDVAFCNLSSRLSKRLLELAARYGKTGDNGDILVDIRLKQRDLANMVGATRESVNKTLKSFEQKNIISMDKGYISILDMEGLQFRAR